MNEKEYLTIKEYAEIKGCSTQYVYRLLKTKLQPFVEVVDGRKVLRSAVLRDLVANNETNQETNQFNQKIIQNDSPSSSLNEEELIRINRRNEELIDSLRADIREKDKQIIDMSNRLADIFEANQRLEERNQQLQMNYQLLLSDGKEHIYEEEYDQGARAQNEVIEETKKKGLFSRLFK